MSRPLVIASLACLLAALALAPSARAEVVTYDEVMAAIQAAQAEEQSPAEPWAHEPEGLRAALAKRPPGPGWCNFQWSRAPVGGDTFLLFLLVSTAKNLDLLDHKDMPCRLLLFDIARRYERDASRAPAGPEANLPYILGLSAMPESPRFQRLYALHCQPDRRAWLLAAAFLRQESGANQLAPDAWKRSPTERSPAFRRFQQRIAALTKEANAMAKRYGARITRNWPSKLERLLENVRTRADLWSMALVADISEKTSTEGLKLITDLFRIDNDQDAHQTSILQGEYDGNCPKLSPPERRLVRKALRALEDYEIEADLDSKRSAAVDKAERIYYRTR